MSRDCIDLLIDYQNGVRDALVHEVKAGEARSKTDAALRELADVLADAGLDRGLVWLRGEEFLVELIDGEATVEKLPDLTFVDRVKRYRPVPAEPRPIPGNGDCCRRRPPVPADASLALDTAIAAENAVEDFVLDLAAGKED